MIIQEPVRLRWGDKLFSIIRTVRTNKEEIAEQFRLDLDAENKIRHSSDPELWYICNEIYDVPYKDLDEFTSNILKDTESTSANSISENND